MAYIFIEVPNQISTKTNPMNISFTKYKMGLPFLNTKNMIHIYTYTDRHTFPHTTWRAYSNSICGSSCIALRRAKSGADSKPPPLFVAFDNWLRWCGWSRRFAGPNRFMAFVSGPTLLASLFVSSASKLRPQLQQHFEQQHCIGGRIVFGFGLCVIFAATDFCCSEPPGCLWSCLKYIYLLSFKTRLRCENQFSEPIISLMLC